MPERIGVIVGRIVGPVLRREAGFGFSLGCFLGLVEIPECSRAEVLQHPRFGSGDVHRFGCHVERPPWLPVECAVRILVDLVLALELVERINRRGIAFRRLRHTGAGLLSWIASYSLQISSMRRPMSPISPVDCLMTSLICPMPLLARITRMI